MFRELQAIAISQYLRAMNQLAVGGVISSKALVRRPRVMPSSQRWIVVVFTRAIAASVARPVAGAALLI